MRLSIAVAVLAMSIAVQIFTGGDDGFWFAIKLILNAANVTWFVYLICVAIYYADSRRFLFMPKSWRKRITTEKLLEIYHSAVNITLLSFLTGGILLGITEAIKDLKAVTVFVYLLAIFLALYLALGKNKSIFKKKNGKK